MILSVDPGKMTGFAIVVHGSVMYGQEPMMEFLRRADDLTMDNVDVEIVCERFQIGPATLSRAKDAHWSMKQIGILEYWAERRGHRFIQQSPAQAKSFSTDDKLRRLGWYVSSSGGHINDALRHLLVYMVDTDQIDLELLLGP